MAPTMLEPTMTVVQQEPRYYYETPPAPPLPSSVAAMYMHHHPPAQQQIPPTLPPISSLPNVHAPPTFGFDPHRTAYRHPQADGGGFVGGGSGGTGGDFMPVGGLRDPFMDERQHAFMMQSGVDLGVGTSRGGLPTWEAWQGGQGMGMEDLMARMQGGKKAAAVRAPRKGKVLHRNKACLSCRARKTKCDAVKPICGSCSKVGTTTECQYDLPPKWLEEVTRGARGVQKRGDEVGNGHEGSGTEEDEDVGRVRTRGGSEVEEGEVARATELQKIIDSLEHRLRDLKVAAATEREKAKGKELSEGGRLAVEDLREGPLSTASPSHPTVQRVRSEDSHSGLSGPDGRSPSSDRMLRSPFESDPSPRLTHPASSERFWHRTPSGGTGPAATSAGSPNDSSSSGDSSSLSHNDSSSKTSASTHLHSASRSPGQVKHELSLSPHLSTSSELPTFTPAAPPPMEPEAQAMLESGWPRTLPSRKICKLLCQAFFNRPLAPFMLMDTSRLLVRLSLPPTHPLFPQASLIHAILATGCMEVSMEALVQPRPYWGRAAGGPAEYHAQWAERMMWDAVETERDSRALHEHAQAAIVLGQWYQTKGMALLLWRSLGLAIRVCSMLGYAKHSPWVVEEKSELWEDEIKGVGPASDAVDGYERSTLWWYAIACERVCCAAAGFAPSISERDISAPIASTHAHIPTFECHSHLSDAFFECHEEDVTGSLQLLTKSSIILGRITCFVQRSSHPTTTPEEIDTGRKALSQLIKRFFDSFPASYRKPVQIDGQGRIDPCLLSVHCQVHALVIHLHEDAVGLSLTDPDLVACANSARILMSWFHQVGNLNIDIGTLMCSNPTLSFALILALRTQVRMMAVHEALGYPDAAAVVRDDLSRVMGRLRESKHLPMGGRSIMVVEELMRNPASLLPRQRGNASTDIKSKSSFIRALRPSS